MQGYAAQFSKEISNLLHRVPKDLLLLLKTNDCLRSVDHALGQAINQFLITARCCSGVSLHAGQPPHQSGCWARWRNCACSWVLLH